LTEFLFKYHVQIGFHDLQSALTGRMVALTPGRMDTRQDADLALLVVNDRGGVTAQHWVTQSLPQRLVKSLLTDPDGRSLRIENAQWEMYQDGTEIPYERLITFENAEGKTEIEIVFLEITKNVPANTPFSIPHNYAKVR
jgi:hypothetical protein